MNTKERKTKSKTCGCSQKQDKDEKKWQKPTLEDVSAKVMAQPYIRFT